MKDALIVSLLSAVPKNLVARWMGVFGRTRFPAKMQQLLLRAYIAKYGPNLDECVGRLQDFDCLTAFFTRALKPGARPIDAAEDSLVSPVDGVCSMVGDVVAGRIPQAPHIDYAVADLLGESFEAARFAVLYLSPKDYHRVHTPREGRVTRYRYLPGRLWPVFPAATRSIRDLFSRNERLVSWVDTDVGPMAVVMVGAFGVGRIRTVYCDVVANTGGEGGGAAVDQHLERGAELGRFELGSTVILIVPRSVRWEVAAGESVRLGQRIAALAR
ncbi:MAG: phosphatidylserine decarboxylase [Myxococcales bacterium]|nr:phosphatidylserine decarboxylase [Myxococcales bacterium]